MPSPSSVRSPHLPPKKIINIFPGVLHPPHPAHLHPPPSSPPYQDGSPPKPEVRKCISMYYNVSNVFQFITTYYNVFQRIITAELIKEVPLATLQNQCGKFYVSQTMSNARKSKFLREIYSRQPTAEELERSGHTCPVCLDRWEDYFFYTFYHIFWHLLTHWQIRRSLIVTTFDTDVGHLFLNLLTLWQLDRCRLPLSAPWCISPILTS